MQLIVDHVPRAGQCGVELGCVASESAAGGLQTLDTPTVQACVVGIRTAEDDREVRAVGV